MKSGLTLPEILVAIVITGIFLWLARPTIIVGPLPKGTQTQMLSNMKQLHLATQQMDLDANTTGDTNIGWPGDLGGSFERWATNLVGGNYLSTNDLCKLLSVPRHPTPPPVMPLTNNNAVLVYAVTSSSSSNTVFLSSANFINSPTGGQPPRASSAPFGQKGFVVFNRGGDGAILPQRHAGNTNIIGEYAPLCK
ncbi:hypothetical protein BH09VER1_BH09VER1_45910 [soil metagenome]